MAARAVRLAALVVPALLAVSSVEAQRPTSRLALFADAWVEREGVVAPPAERRAFLELETAAQRELFIRHFWRARSVEQARRFRGHLRAAAESEARSEHQRELLVLAGQPRSVSRIEGCDLLRPLEVWNLEPPGAADPDAEPVIAVLVRRAAFDPRSAEVWSPGTLALLLGEPAGPVDALTRRLAAERCLPGARLTALRQALEAARSLAQLRRLYQIEAEDARWLARLRPLLAGAALPRDATLRLEPLGRMSRSTVVRGLVAYPRAAVRLSEEGFAADEVEIVGDVWRGRRLVDSFRVVHRLAGRLPGAPVLELDFYRRLFPGSYQLELRVSDGRGVAWLRETRPLVVESQDTVAPPPAGRRRGYASLTRGEVVQLTTFPSVELLPPPERLLGESHPVRAATTGDAVAAVRFAVDDLPPTVDRQPPYLLDLELDTGERRVVAEALDARGSVLARDTAIFRPGPRAFALQLEVDARPQWSAGHRVPVSVRVPEDRRLEEVSCFHDGQRVETLSREGPWSCPWPRDLGVGLHYLRVLARLDSGDVLEDLVFVGDTPESLDVALAELFVSVLTEDGRPVAGLSADHFSVELDGRPLHIERFATVDELPLSVAILLDTSSSMTRSVDIAGRSTQRFFDRLLRVQDRAGLLTFNHDVRVRSDFTQSRAHLARAAKGLRSWGSTRLYDALGFALHQFAGGAGRRALVVLSDGSDTESDLGLDEVVGLADRAGVMIFPVSLGIDRARFQDELAELARRTGGRHFSASSVAGLDRIFAAIEEILRTQYLLVVRADAVDVESVRVRAGAGLRTSVQGYRP